MSEMNAQSSSSLWRDAWIRLSRNRMAVVGGAVLLTLGLLSLCAPWISPYRYETQNLELGATGPQLTWDTQQLVYGTCTQQRAQVLAAGYKGRSMSCRLIRPSYTGLLRAKIMDVPFGLLLLQGIQT